MPTTLNLTPKQIQRYRDSATQHFKRENAEIESRRQQAWQSAQYATRILKEKFKATRVVAFGSLVHPAGFTRWSDVDIAAWGIDPEDTIQAIGVIAELDTAVTVNLVDVNTARPSILAVIKQDGIEL
jgi:predicted nucleotidyltransferase